MSDGKHLTREEKAEAMDRIEGAVHAGLAGVYTDYANRMIEVAPTKDNEPAEAANDRRT